MAGVKISALPAIPSCVLTDLIAEVQPASGGTTYKATLQQVLTLFNANIQITEAQVTNLVTDLAGKLSLTGGTMSGVISMGSNFITNLLDPVNPQDAATKAYADMIAGGFTVLPAVRVATTGALTATYDNGASGVGATLTNAGVMASINIDGVALILNDRVLVKNQTNTFENGIYIVTTVGSGAANWILTRATDYDEPSEINPGDLVVVNEGTVNTQTSWIETATVATIGTDAILFSQFTANPSTFLKVANNLSDVANATTSRTNISAAESGVNADITATEALTEIRDATGAIIVEFLSEASAVNYMQISNRASPSAPFLRVDGTDANIPMRFAVKNHEFRFWDYTTTVPARIRLYDNTGNFGVSLGAPTALAAGVDLTLPSVDGSADSVMQTDGAGNLSFSTIVTSGTYTPTVSNTTNVSSSTPQVFQYMRVGNVVTVSGIVNITATGAGTIVFTLSLPIASNFATQTQCAGVACQPQVATYITGRIVADTTNHGALVQGVAGDTVDRGWALQFTYLIV